MAPCEGAQRCSSDGKSGCDGRCSGKGGSFSFLPAIADQKILLARASAEKGDVLGTFCLHECFEKGIGCAKHESVADELLERAADLGSFSAYCELVENRSLDLCRRIQLLVSFLGIHAADSKDLHSFLETALDLHIREGSYSDLVFEVGELFTKNTDFSEGMVFGRREWPCLIDVLMQIVSLHDERCDAALEACIAWVLIAKRMRLNKDVRKMVSKMVWAGRRDGRQCAFYKTREKKGRLK